MSHHIYSNEPPHLPTVFEGLMKVENSGIWRRLDKNNSLLCIESVIKNVIYYDGKITMSNLRFKTIKFGK